MMRVARQKKRTLIGFGVLEILVASAVISIAFVSLFSVFVLSQRAVMRAGEKVRANFIAEEGVEVMRYLRDRSWSGNLANLAPVTDYYLSFSATSSVWSIVASSSPGLIDGIFKRAVRVAAVRRDSNDNIVGSGGTVDVATWKVAVVVSWGTRSVSAETYLANIFDN